MSVFWIVILVLGAAYLGFAILVACLELRGSCGGSGSFYPPITGVGDMLSRLPQLHCTRCDFVTILVNTTQEKFCPCCSAKTVITHWPHTRRGTTE